jgi:hypothetical protein
MIENVQNCTTWSSLKCLYHGFQLYGYAAIKLWYRQWTLCSLLEMNAGKTSLKLRQPLSILMKDKTTVTFLYCLAFDYALVIIRI